MERIKLDGITRILLISIVVIITYTFLSFILQLSSSQPRTMMDMMTGYHNSLSTAISLAIALFLGLITGLVTTSEKKAYARYDKKQALQIIRKKLSDDEKMLLKEVEKAGKITQDSLRARVGWSKAKISTTLTRLDKMGLIQKRRIGKTYDIFLSKDFGSV